LRDLVIAVPSHGRAKTIKTLKALEDAGVDTALVDVWVLEDEEDDYRDNVLNANLRTHDSPVGLVPARNVIARAYPVGTPLVVADDDVKQFVQLSICGHEIRPVKALLDHVEYLFDFADDHALRLWGISANKIPFWMKNTVLISGQKGAPGTFFGYRVSGGDEEIVTVGDGEVEDIERTCNFLRKDGAIVFGAYLGIDSRQRKEIGGLQNTRTAEKVETEIREMVEMFPEYLRYRAPARGKTNPTAKFIVKRGRTVSYPAPILADREVLESCKWCVQEMMIA
jgi:hypothetical protein